MSTDERLALRAAQGDQRALGEIYERYHQELYRFCLAMLGNPQDAQDAMQNAMVKLLRTLPGEKREIKLKPWLYRIARNESIEVLRRRRDSVELEPEQAMAPGVAETAEARERLRTLLADLGQLPERQRAALLMRELSGLDFAQIGTAFGSSAAVARQTLYEARLSLRQLEAGREMRCADVMRELSDADGRVARRRAIRAHLRSCADCRAFRDGIAKRHDDLAALAPMPVAASTAVLHGVLGQTGANGASAAGGSGLASAAGLGAGKAIATSAVVKSAAAVAVAAVVGVSAAGRSGLIDVPLVADGRHSSNAEQIAPRRATQAHGSAGAAHPGSTSGATTAAPRSERPGTDSRHGPRGSGREEGKSSLAGAPQDESPSTSQAGLSPPGGGYGRSASERKDKPEQVPEAAERGQQTATSRRPGEAGSPPDRDAPAGGPGEAPRDEAPTPPAAEPAAPAKPPAAAPPVSQAPGETPSPGDDRGSTVAPGTGRER